MTVATHAARYSLGEEIANSVIHGIGVILAIGGLGVLTAFAARQGSPWAIVGCSIFGFCLILCYATSTLYHAITHHPTKHVLRILDHSAIFLLIAGTYTPFTLVNLRGPSGWTLFGVVWGIALLGILFKATMLRKWTFVSVVLYVLMGWAAVFATKPLVASVEPGGVKLLLYGGIAYTGGIVFYAWRSLPYQHAIWHIFVLLGSTLHFFAVLLYVIPYDAA